jgi:hypothetical protein
VLEWESRPRGNLYFTFVLYVPSILTALRVNLAAPLAVTLACEDELCFPRVKWPNDVWVNGRKLSGMLVNSRQVGDLQVTHKHTHTTCTCTHHARTYTHVHNNTRVHEPRKACLCRVGRCRLVCRWGSGST